MSSAPQQQESLALAKTSPLILDLATEWKMSAVTMIETLKATVFPQKDRENKQITVTNAQLMMFLQVCSEYHLNPFIKEIYAFPTKGGGIVPMVPVDGWSNIVNRHKDMDGVEFVDEWETDPKTRQRSLISTTAVIYRKDRAHATRITEYMQECYQDNKEPWKKWPARMLRHKAFIQCARIAFSLAGIYDPDEAERIAESENNNKEAITRPTRASAQTINGTQTESAAVSSNSPNGEQTGATKSADVGTAVVPATETKPCLCNCCRVSLCDCKTKDEVDQCNCEKCQQYMRLSTVPTEVAGQPTAAELFPPKTGERVKHGEPYVAPARLKKLFAVARSAFGDDYEKKVDEILKDEFGISSKKEIPETLFDQVLKAVGGDKLNIK